MTACEYELYHVPGRPGGWEGRGPYDHLRQAVRCKTHDWIWPEPGPPIDSATLCPLGRIEDATEKALAKIEAKMRDAQS